MTERRVTFQIDIDLARGSKEAHAVTVDRLARMIGHFATDQMEAYGYTVRRSKVTTTLHYVRHVLPAVIKAPKRLRVVRSANQ